ncbi:KH domain-containing, RNA-binding, signal transduction-associated protein 2 [Frankliniella fusca]|uniref:KH domain-containing, RNA-binding, signal transduction-associated protein 2 n=1 Tax=Frankliniella fusca TaxID=407009 RepID=A0AAE1LEZ9_9NEOP|nr:KH domain-containing, RNA-binding, signal transduction-associated protein 2 [Frankliniella fusca]
MTVRGCPTPRSRPRWRWTRLSAPSPPAHDQARLRHSVSSDFGGGGGGAGGQGILEASTWTWARVLGVDEDPEHALRGGRAWRVDLGRARRLTSHSRFAKTRVRVTVQPVTRHGE